MLNTLEMLEIHQKTLETLENTTNKNTNKRKEVNTGATDI